MAATALREPVERPLRILVVLGKLAARYGGPPLRTVEFCSALSRLGHQVELFTTDVDGRGHSDVPLVTPVPMRGFVTTYHHASTFGQYSISYQVTQSLRRRLRDFDVVHLKGFYEYPIIVGARIARGWRVPYIIEPSGVFDEYHRRRSPFKKLLHDRLVGDAALRNAAAVRYASEAERRQAEKAALQGRSYVIPPGIEFPPVELADEEREPGLIVYVGRLSSKKGLDILVDAFATVAERLPDSHLVIAGPDEGLGAALRLRAQKHGIASRVIWRAPVAAEEKFRLLGRASVFALPSAGESFGASVYEAMAMGAPVVVSEGIANYEQLASERAGLVVPRTPEAVAGAIQFILEDPQVARSIGQRASRLARALYSADVVAKQLEAMYIDVTQRSFSRRTEAA